MKLGVILLCIGMCTLGMLVHFLKKMADVEATGTVLSPWQHARTAPYRTALAIVSSYLLLYVYFEMNMLNPLVGLFSGMACSSAYDSLRARAIKRIQADDERPEPGP